MNQRHGLDKYAHYYWISALREKLKYETVESQNVVSTIIESFRAKGWRVVILTSRGENQRESTERQLKECGVEIPMSDVIFRDSQRNGKDVCLAQWIQAEKLDLKHVLFVDDNPWYCKVVKNVEKLIDGIKANCLHFTGAIPNPELSKEQLERALIQWMRFEKGEEFLDVQITEKNVQAALTYFGMNELTQESLYAELKKRTEDFTKWQQ